MYSPVTTDPASSTPAATLSGAVRAVCMVASLVLLVSALGGFAAAWRIPPKPGWAMMGFEFVIAVSGAFGILLARGKLPAVPALTLACIAGSVFVGSVLGYFGVQKKLGEHSLTSLLLGRVGLAAIYGSLAVGIAIGPSRDARRLLVRAVVALLPLVGIAAWYRFFRLAPLLGGGDSPLEILRLAGLTILAVAAGASLCASLHWGIRSFEVARSPGAQA